MVLPVIAPAVVSAIIGLARLIAYILGIVYTSSYIRDVVTKTQEAQIQQSEDAALTTILNNPTLTPEQKTQTVFKYLNVQQLEGKTDWQSTIMTLSLVAVGAYVVTQILGGKK